MEQTIHFAIRGSVDVRADEVLYNGEGIAKGFLHDGMFVVPKVLVSEFPNSGKYDKVNQEQDADGNDVPPAEEIYGYTNLRMVRALWIAGENPQVDPTADLVELPSTAEGPYRTVTFQVTGHFTVVDPFLVRGQSGRLVACVRHGRLFGPSLFIEAAVAPPALGEAEGPEVPSDEEWYGYKNLNFSVVSNADGKGSSVRAA